MGKARKRFEVFEGENWQSNERWFWRVKAGNSKIFMVGGEGFRTVSTCLRAVDTVNALLKEPLSIEVLRP